MSMNRKKGGFTLIEVLIAVAILSMISVLSWQSMIQMINAQENSVDRDEALQALRLTFDKFFTDITQSFLVSAEHKGAMQASKPGFVGTKNSLNFASFSGRRYFDLNGGSDQCEVGYSLENDEENTGAFLIMRREAMWIDDKPEEGGKSYPLMEGVKDLAFEYYDEKEKTWVPEWNSTQVSKHDRLPRAVRVTLTTEERDRGEAVGESVWVMEFPIPLHLAPLDF